jgi:hypothetical protein
MWSVQCYLPRLAAETLPITQMRDRARAAGLTHAMLEYSYDRSQARCRVTCQRPVAEFLAAELRAAVAAATDEHTRTACEVGLSALLIELAIGGLSSEPLHPGGLAG